MFKICPTLTFRKEPCKISFFFIVKKIVIETFGDSYTDKKFLTI